MQRKPPIIDVAALVKKNSFDTREDADTLLVEIRSSLDQWICAIIDFRGIETFREAAVHEAFVQFLPERRQCRIIVRDHLNQEGRVYGILDKLQFKKAIKWD